MQAVIMAGGKGTRVSGISGELPKPMLEIGGIPVLEHGIRQLASQGVTDIIITVGHKADKIMGYFQDGKNFGADIQYFVEDKPLGSAGALAKIRDRLDGDFMLLNGDILFDVDFMRMLEFHKAHHASATLFCHPNSHPYDSSLIVADESWRIQGWVPKDGRRPQYCQNLVNAGIHILNASVLKDIKTEGKLDLDKDILMPLAGTGRMYAYKSPEYVKDMGTPERYAESCRDYESGKPHKKNLKNRQSAIFMDRDGTVNQSRGFLTELGQMELEGGAAEAIHMVNESGRLAIIATNQPALARGELTREGLKEIHNKMEALLGGSGAYIDGLYYCPHHPDKGFDGEVPELKVRCKCRKPGAGMLHEAARDFNIDLASSWMVGDSQRDIEAGRRAGCRTALIGSGDFGQDITAGSLLEAVQKIHAKEN